MNSYEGSPSLSPEAREKVLQTFRHTLQLVRDGRNEEALLGCDFILKMDARFAPAHRLLGSLRGVPAGQRVDVAPFAVYFEAAPPAGPGPFESGPASPAPAPAVRPAPPPSGGGLDDLVFDDFPAAAPAPPAPAGASPAPFAETSFADLSEPARPSVSSIAPPPPAAPAAPSPSTAPAPAARPATPEPPAASLDPRIAQFLRQGDEAMGRGNAQEAIDLWSRVFLIDLSNEEASKRIDSAREALADSARKVDVLLSEGVQLYDAGDLQGARTKFLDVLALSEHDATARSYMNQIDSALAAPASGSAADSEFLRNEIEAPRMPAFAEEGEGLDPGQTLAVVVPDETAPSPEPKASRPAARKRPSIDLRLILPVGLVIVAAAAGGAWWFFRGRRPAAPPSEPKAAAPAAAPAPGTPARPKAAPEDDPIAKAQALYTQGKVEAAIQALLAVPENDPRHTEALTKIDQYRNAGAPTPVPAAPNETALAELRAQGLAAMKASRYIEAVKALDPVVKAHAEDTEAQQALRRARESVDALRSAVKSYAEADYESAVKLLWELRKADVKNQDVEDYLVNAYVNSGIQSLQSGNNARAAEAFQEAVKIRPSDADAQRYLKFTRKYPKGATDLMSRIFVRHVSLRP